MERNRSGRKRQSLTKVACNECRKRKQKCEGERPVCKTCQARNVSCNYDTEDASISRTVALKQENEFWKRKAFDTDSCIKLIIKEPIERARDLMALMNDEAQGGVHAVLRMLAPPATNPQISPHPTARSILPASSSRLEYELMNTQRNAYPAAMVAGHLPRNVYDNGAWSKKPVELGDAGHGSIYSIDSTSPFSYTNESFASKQSIGGPITYPTDANAFKGPIEPPVYCDIRLGQIEITHWTAVPISNELAASIISHYLLAEHPVFTVFDADLFLRDMVLLQTEFCNDLLVNVVLFNGSIGYSAIDPHASRLMEAFGLAAARLLDRDSATDTIITAAAAKMMSLAYTKLGEDKRGLELHHSSRKMALRIGLFGRKRRSLVRTNKATADRAQAASYTAWGMFNAVCVWSMFYHVEVPSHPPLYQIPGDSIDDLAGASQPLLPYMGGTFTLLCKFWLTAGEIMGVYYSDLGTPIAVRVPFSFAESMYNKLLIWARDLPDCVTQGRPRWHHLAILHIYFHSFVTDIFRPFMDDQTITLRSFSYNESDPRAVFKASITQLKQYVRQYKDFYGTPYLTLFWHPALIYVANAMIEDPADHNSSYYMLLSIDEHIILSRAFPVTGMILKGLLSMATEKGVISMDLAKEKLAKLHAVQAERKFNLENKSSLIVVDYNRSLIDDSGSRVDKLTDHLRKQLEFNEFLDTNVTNSGQMPMGENGGYVGAVGAQATDGFGGLGLDGGFGMEDVDQYSRGFEFDDTDGYDHGGWLGSNKNGTNYNGSGNNNHVSNGNPSIYNGSTNNHALNGSESQSIYNGSANNRASYGTQPIYDGSANNHASTVRQPIYNGGSQTHNNGGGFELPNNTFEGWNGFNNPSGHNAGPDCSGPTGNNCGFETHGNPLFDNNNGGSASTRRPNFQGNNGGTGNNFGNVFQ